MAEQKAKTRTIKVLRVAAKRDSFRRAGRAFTREATDLPLADLKKGEIEALKSEPNLVVVEADAEVPAAADAE
jgi:hypothetical protein